MITDFKQFTMNESLSHFDLSKLVTIVAINKDEEGNWIYLTKDNNEFILKKDQVNKLSKIDEKFAAYVNSGNPITKYFETEQDNNVITFAANFAADAVALNEGRVYLIERKDGRGWALPGGFIDAGETAEQAVIRELQEETLAKREDIKSIEPLGIVRCNDPREINFFTYPFIIHMETKPTTDNPMGEMKLKFADDAKNGKWLLLNRASKTQLAFSHHNEILKMVSF